MAWQDRTTEFSTLVNRFSKGSSNLGTQKLSIEHHKSQFKCAAQEIARKLKETSSTLETLNKLANKRHVSIDNSTRKIDELTHIVKQNITNLNGQLEALAALQTREREYRKNAQTKGHTDKVLGALNADLKDITKQFHHVLETRTESLKAQQKQTKALTGGISSLDIGSSTSFGLEATEGSSTEVAIRMPQSMMAMENYDASRMESVENIERTMTELQTIFQKLGQLVHIQGDMVERIDANIEDGLRNVEGAHNEFIKYLQSISGNRGLAVKIFLVLVFFIVKFVLFFL